MLNLEEAGRDGATLRLRAVLPPQTSPVEVRYHTRTGALLRVDGQAAGAFDREHHSVVLPAAAQARELLLDVELEALPTHGLPSGPGVIWWWLNARKQQTPGRALDVRSLDGKVPGAPTGEPAGELLLIGHSHLDVAWLWTYDQARRKAARTFAIACELLDRDPAFVFIQSQPQLYDFVREGDPALDERVRAHVRAGRFDASVAAMWVESDCNIPSGESLLRQMLEAYEYCRDELGVTPQIAWLPDSFGFANTLPQLLAHAGIPYFATTKLQWNDTTKFPYPQFRWVGPDGSGVVSALIQSYDGGPYFWRVRRAKERREPLVLGYGDGGGGVTPKMLEQARSLGSWIHPLAWLREVSAREELPQHRDELYLEYHRGIYTTHHDMKFHNALLERALNEAEELLAWCLAVHAPKATVEQFQERLRAVWRTLLRNQFHDVLPGTAIEPVYRDALAEYTAAEAVVAGVLTSAQAMLPRARRHEGRIERCEPRLEHEAYLFDNGLLQARVRGDGTIVELAVSGGRNLCTQGNVLALYADRPRQWEAWNLDRGYERSMRGAAAKGCRIEDGALIVDLLLGGSPASLRISLAAGEPFLRVDLDVDWRERRRLLRIENWFAVQAQSVHYGSPHGSIERTARPRTPAERAKFEVPGQRFAAVRDADGDGIAILTLDTYGWNARALAGGGVRVGHSLLRGTTWPDPHADLGAHTISYAYAPFAGASTGALERAWMQFAHEPRVRLFTCEDDAVIVAACKPAQDRDGAIVRVRECNGQAREVRLRCGARMTQALAADALERPLDLPVALDGEHLVFTLSPYQLRTFRVRFSHES